MTSINSSLRAGSSRVLSLKYAMGACFCVLGADQVQRLGSDWSLALCGLESCAAGNALLMRSWSCTASSSASSALPTDWSSSAGRQLLSWLCR